MFLSLEREELTRTGNMMNAPDLPIHPYTGLQALGLLRNGAPIWPVYGGADDPEPPKDPEGGTKGEDSEEDKGGAEDDKKDSPEDTKAQEVPAGPDWKARSRQNENAKKVAEKKLKAVLSALGITEDGQLTAEQLKEKLAEAGNETKGLKLENAVIRAANKAKIDADELTDSRKFMSKLDTLDPQSDEFSEAVSKLVLEEVKARPSLKSGTDVKKPAGSSGKEVKGTDKRQLTKEDLEKLSHHEIVKAQKEGRLADLLGTKK